MITIKKPNIVTVNGKTRLQTIINIDGEKKQIWFEVNTEYKDYLCYERSDAFVISLLLLAMQKGYKLKCEQAVSEQLYFNLTKYLIPFLVKINSNLNSIEILCELDSTILKSENIVGTGISCGVDSLSTILYHGTTTKSKNYKIDYLTLFNSGYYGYDDNNTERFKKYTMQSRKFSNEFDYPLLFVDSNISNVTKYNFIESHTYLTCSVVLALQKFFNIYYYASGYSIYDFNANFDDPAYYDLFLLDCISTENVKFISANTIMSRVEKIHSLIKHEKFLKHLYVCTSGKPPYNCGKCEKCVRTLLAIDAMASLEKVSENFNVNAYKARRSINIATMLVKKNNNTYYKEIYDSFKSSPKSIPLKSYLIIPFAYLNVTTIPKLKSYITSKLNQEQKETLKRIIKKYI